MAIFTTVDVDGVRHSRSTFAKAEACDSPDWVARIGSSGGAHSFETCPRCWLESLARKYRRDTGIEAAWAQQDAAHYESLKRENVATHRLSADEFEFLGSKQAARIARIARYCPDRRLPDVLRELRMLCHVAAQQSKAATSVEQSNACLMRYFVAQQAASVAWERLKLICDDALALRRLRSFMPPSNPYNSTWE